MSFSTKELNNLIKTAKELQKSNSKPNGPYTYEINADGVVEIYDNNDKIVFLCSQEMFKKLKEYEY